MPDLSPDIVGEVVEACKAGVAEAIEAFGRGIDAEVQLTVGEPITVDIKALPDGFSGPGLVVVMIVGDQAALLMLPESSGFVPQWTADPDPTGKSKLTTLAQELGMILLPEDYMPEDFKAARVKTLAGALARGGVADGAALLPLELENPDGRRGQATLIWPAAKPASVIGAGASKPKPKPAKKPQREPKVKSGPQPSGQPKAAEQSKAPLPTKPDYRRPATLATLPEYTRSLLRVQLPVVVTLAEKRQPLNRIMELGPGSIIQFDKSCEEMLELDVGGQAVATGEAVKVGDKFGLRINSIILPQERFGSVRRGGQSGDAQRTGTGRRVLDGNR